VIVDLDFALPDPDGGASGWTWTSHAAFHWAAFTSSNGFGSRFDAFEFGWSADNFVGALDGTNTSRAFFSVPMFNLAADGFEKNWNNDGFLFELVNATFAAFAPSMGVDEDFEAGWSNVPFLFAFGGGDVTSGGIDDFESGWAPGYLFAFGGGDVTSATFTEGALTQSAESFEAFKADQVIASVTVASSTLNIVAHGFVDGDKVTLFPAVDDISQLPNPLASGVNYFVVNSLANVFQLAPSSGGAPIVLNDSGSGSNYVRTDTSKNWGGRDGDTSGSDP